MFPFCERKDFLFFGLLFEQNKPRVDILAFGEKIIKQLETRSTMKMAGSCRNSTHLSGARAYTCNQSGISAVWYGLAGTSTGWFLSAGRGW